MDHSPKGEPTTCNSTQGWSPGVVIVTSFCSWHLGFIRDLEEWKDLLETLRLAGKELLSQGVHPVVLNCPHRIQWTDSNETWAEAQLNSLRYNRLLTEFAQQPPWRLLNLHALMAACGNECNKDRVHARPPVYDAAVQPDDLSHSEDFSLSDDTLEFKRMADAFARQELAPNGAAWDAGHIFPLDTIRAAAGLGFGAMYVPEDVGGSGLSRLDAAVVFEELSYGDVPVTAYLSIHNMVAGVIDRYGTPQQREMYLPRMATAEVLASYCLTEPGSGSDAASLKTTAKRDGDDYVLTGSKAFISGGSVSDLYLVMARTGAPGPKGISAFLVEKGAPGLSFGKREEKLGWNAQPTTAVIMDGVRVPARARVGVEGQGFAIAMAALDGGRVNIGACSLGGAAFCLDAAARHARERRQFGRPLADFQATQFRLADMATALHASRLAVRHAARALDAGAPQATMACAMAKRLATDACYDLTNDALQLLGGYGYLKEYPVERYMRDLRVHSILEGTNEIMRVIISRELERLGGV
ncbi:Isobutyryl-CoA dehydrogenase, mitochondrial [Auxenochlorella protothecoides]|uniref:Isobutyryl-CoA dehydrogenase, mitochondrial n=1 Tax=Auxenochlorella protothecoides TaxID=3075 RepID=A0A087SI17_AUXPR|nr:Isobutyryl-CoA dehydrogenase, mitochondrial [Auxenochlorella protothecoides]KFM25371.1 Isobutyryl-CoA dehydrogenase, mitochondrial [Auxenochlorella protothecoides]